jgi:serine/threonine-protein kinase RsbW
MGLWRSAAEPQMGDPSTGRSRDAAPLILRQFDRSTLTELRHSVVSCLTAAGLAGESLDDFVLAINELMTNAVRHGGGSGLLRLWDAGDRLVCEISDAGSGISGQRVGVRDRPSPHVAGGWGLWLARQLTGTMAVTTGHDGTLVRITAPRGDMTRPGATFAC